MTSTSCAHASNTLARALSAIALRSSLNSIPTLLRRAASRTHDGEHVAHLLGLAHAIRDDLVQASAAVTIERQFYFVRGSAGGVAAQNVVGHQGIDALPILFGKGACQFGLVKLRAGKLKIPRMMLPPQNIGDCAAQTIPRDPCIRIDRAENERRLLYAAATLDFTTRNLIERPADEFRRSRRAYQHAIRHSPREFQHAWTRSRKPNGNRPRTHDQPPTGNAEPPAFEFNR